MRVDATGLAHMAIRQRNRLSWIVASVKLDWNLLAMGFNRKGQKQKRSAELYTFFTRGESP